MRYSTEPNYRKYVEGYGFLSFARKFGDKYVKKLMDAATKTGIDPAKTASKKVFQKTAEATGDLIGKKIANKITSACKAKSIYVITVMHILFSKELLLLQIQIIICMIRN